MSNTRHTTEGSEHATPDNPAVEAGMSRDIINIPDNVIQDGIGGYTEEQQDLLQWAVSYGRHDLGNSRDRLCQAIGCDWTTLTRVLTGKYGAAIETFCDKIKDLQVVAAESFETGFVETVVTRRICELLDYALSGDLDGGKVVMIVGPTGRSKSETVKHWCRQNNHGRSVYIDCPESGGLSSFFRELAIQTGVNVNRSTNEIRDRLIKSFNRRRILVIDEVARLLPSRRVERVPPQLDFIRRLHDVRRCAVAMVATPIFDHEMNSGWLQMYMEQMIGRCDPLIVPAEPRRDEIRDICTAYVKRPSKELVALALQISREKGRLRVLFDLMKKAGVVARKRGEDLDVKHLDAAYQRRKNRTVWPEDTAA